MWFTNIVITDSFEDVLYYHLCECELSAMQYHILLVIYNFVSGLKVNQRCYPRDVPI